MQKRLVEVFPLKRGHATIIPCLAIEDEIDGEQRATEDASTVQQALPNVTGSCGIYGCLRCVVPSKRRLEDISRFRQDRRLWFELVSEDIWLLLQWRRMEES